ncbi:putative indole-3-pyruvate monooxygenase [Dioscorea sansibarensis]
MSKNHFITYIDDYVDRFKLCPRLWCKVESALLDDEEGKWQVVARNLETGKVEEYVARFVVVATGENDEAVVPEFPGIESFAGQVIHSMVYRNGSNYKGKDVLVVGCGNSGMEIALDLSNSDDYLIGEDGISKQKIPNHWKERHGLYCAGLARKGIYGTTNEAENIANDINNLLKDEICIQSYTHICK